MIKLPKIITAEWLEELDSCYRGIAAFRARFPNGAPKTMDTLRAVVSDKKLLMHMCWLVNRLSEEEWSDYQYPDAFDKHWDGVGEAQAILNHKRGELKRRYKAGKLTERGYKRLCKKAVTEYEQTYVKSLMKLLGVRASRKKVAA